MAAPMLVVGGIVMWLTGTWVVPWSRDGYVRRLMHLWSAWATHAQWAYDQFSQRQGKFDARLAALSPPQCIADHERLVSLVTEIDRLRTQTAIPFPERARQVTLTLQTARQTKDELVLRAATGDERRYAAALDRLFEEPRSEYATAAARSERATEQAMQKLARIRPPAPAAAEHEALVAAFGAQLTAARESHAAAQAADPERAAAVAAQWDAAMAALRDARTRITDRLGHGDRWPVPADSAATDGAHQ
jgi:hypothetical protein